MNELLDRRSWAINALLLAGFALVFAALEPDPVASFASASAVSMVIFGLLGLAERISRRADKRPQQDDE